jgi:hypothetical protein
MDHTIRSVVHWSHIRCSLDLSKPQVHLGAPLDLSKPPVHLGAPLDYPSHRFTPMLPCKPPVHPSAPLDSSKPPVHLSAPLDYPSHRSTLVLPWTRANHQSTPMLPWTIQATGPPQCSLGLSKPLVHRSAPLDSSKPPVHPGWSCSTPLHTYAM